MNRQKCCLYSRNVTSYVILIKPGEVLLPLVTDGITLFSKKQKVVNLGIKNRSENRRYLFSNNFVA